MALAAVDRNIDNNNLDAAKKWIETYTGEKQLSPYGEMFLSINDGDWDDIFHQNSSLILASFMLFNMPEKFGKILGKLQMKFPRLFSWSVYFYPLPWVSSAITPLQLIFLLKSQKFGFIRKNLIKRMERKLLKDQLENGSWFGISEFTLASIYALYELGYGIDGSQISKGLNFLDSLIGVEGDLNTVQLPVWETSLAVISLLEAGISPTDQVIENAVEFLKKTQMDHGGWPFSYSCHPDNDDTAYAILALNKISSGNNNVKSVITKGIEFLSQMQNDDGSWSLYCKNQCHVKYKMGDEMWVDAGSTDITGHVLQVLGETGNESSKSVKKAIKWLKDNQTDYGSWWGRWGLCYTYGTSCVLQGLKSVGVDPQSDYVLKAIDWLNETQNSDGGWGEHHSSYYSETPVLGPSTVEQTSWALSSLIDVNVPSDPEITETIKKGISFLGKIQREDGGFPSSYSAVSVSFCKYKLYSAVFPLLALSKFKKQLKEV
ncbi:prenyltransferase/squalene oxidase repeat-containing protein [Methanobacterium petrolearium]|nr:hypothetical protein GCM10025861_13770 [Methanobacterium petrolearium]